MAQSATLEHAPASKPPVGRAPKESEMWWLGLVGPITIGLVAAAICWLSAISF